MRKGSALMSLMAMSLAGFASGVDHRQMYGEREPKRTLRTWEDLSPDEQKKYLDVMEQRQKDLAMKKGMKEFKFLILGEDVSLMALNQKTAEKKLKNILVDYIKRLAEAGEDFPQEIYSIKPAPKHDKLFFKGFRKIYSENKKGV